MSNYNIWDDFEYISNDDEEEKKEKKYDNWGYSRSNVGYKNSWWKPAVVVDERACITKVSGFSMYDLKEYCKILGLENALKCIDLLKDADSSYVIPDIFYLFFEENRNFNITEENAEWYKQLSGFDSYVVRSYSVNNKMYCYVITANILEYVLFNIANNSKDNAGNMMNDINGANGTGSGLEKAFQNSSNQNKNIEDLMSEMGIGADSADMLKDIKLFHENGISFNLSNVRKFFKKLFGKKGIIRTDSADYEVHVEDIESAVDIIDFVEMESLVTDTPIYDVFTKRSAKIIFDIYVDVSGSMEGQDILVGKDHVSRMSMAKVIAMKMHKMGILDNIFLFDGKVLNTKINHPSEIKFSGGGTVPDECVKHRKIADPGNKKRYLILTDGDCSHNIYDEKCLMMCIAGRSSCESYSREIMKNDQYKQSMPAHYKYLTNKQYLFYNGTSIMTMLDKVK